MKFTESGGQIDVRLHQMERHMAASDCLLDHRGARVDTVQSAAAALDKLGAQAYDVLSDLGLPEQDGFALLEQVRARGHLGRALRAVALTGYASEADARLCKEAGFELHLVKPITPWEARVPSRACSSSRLLTSSNDVCPVWPAVCTNDRPCPDAHPSKL